MPQRIEVLFRPATGGRWKQVCVAPDYATAAAQINAAGDWRLHVVEDASVSPSLFDEGGPEPEAHTGGLVGVQVELAKQ